MADPESGCLSLRQAEYICVRRLSLCMYMCVCVCVCVRVGRGVDSSAAHLEKTRNPPARLDIRDTSRAAPRVSTLPGGGSRASARQHRASPPDDDGRRGEESPQTRGRSRHGGIQLFCLSRSRLPIFTSCQSNECRSSQLGLSSPFLFFREEKTD